MVGGESTLGKENLEIALFLHKKNCPAGEGGAEEGGNKRQGD